MKRDDAERRVHELRKQGLSHRAIEARLKVEGLVLSKSAIQRLVPARRGKAPRVETVVDVPDDASQEDLEGLLRRQLAVVERLSKQAEKDKNLTAFAQIQRVLNATAALLSRVTPPPPVDPSSAPDVQADAAEARELLHTAVERAIKRRVA